MNIQDSIENLRKDIASLKQQNSQLERTIVELKASEESKKRIIDVFRSTPQMMAISNLSDGKYIEVNQNFLDTLGYSREDIIGKSSDEIDLFASIVQSNKFIKKLPRLKKVKDFIVSINTKSGETIDFKFSAEPVFIGEERFLLTSYTPVDISELSDLEINQTFERLRELFESLTNFVMVVNPDIKGRIIIEYINKDSREFRNFDPDNIIGKDLRGLDIRNKDVILELIGKIVVSGQPNKQTILDFGKEDEGYYFGIRLNTGEVILIWEPGVIQRSREKELLAQGDVFERFADMIPNGVFEINLKGKLTYSNANGLETFGYTSADMEKGLSIRHLFGESDLKAVFDNLKMIDAPGKIITNEYIAYTSAGKELPVLSHTTGIYDMRGKLLGYRGVLTDISEKKKIQDEILKEKIQLETLIESAPESIVWTTQDGTIEKVNREFIREFGYTEKECIGSNIDELLIPEDIADEGREFTERACKNETISVETYRKRKSGEKIFVSLLIKPVSFRDRTTSLFAIYRNISDKQRESDLKAVIQNISNVALTQTEFQDIFTIFKNEIGKLYETKNFYIVLYDEKNQTLNLPLYTDEKDAFDMVPIKGTLTGWLIREGKPSLLKEKDIEVLEKKMVIDLVGTPCKVWMGVPLTIENKIIGAMVLQDYENESVFTDHDLEAINLIGNQIALVIQRKEMLANLVIERKKAEEAARLKQQFMSTMSHEIRTPLNEVIGITNLLLQGNPRSDQMEYIKTLRFSGNHLLTLVNDVLDFNKMESGMIVFEKTLFSLTDFLNDLKRTYSFRTDEKGLKFDIERSENMPDEIIGDPIRLNQVLSNLLSNAIKFTSSGSVKLSIKEEKRDQKNIDLKFEVSDSGIGIPEDKLETIFESYTQASEDTTRKYGGTGLGLSIVKKLTELQGSTIEVFSEKGKGSTFSFNLKFILSENTSQRKPEETTEEEQFNQLLGKKILIAEDNKINFFVANKFLTKWGITVSHAENGKIAIDMINKNEYDLILMDLHMPEMDGIEATEILRSSEKPEISTIPIVALTAAIMSEHEDKIEGLNINDYILKPFKPKELYDKILKNAR